MHSRVLVINTPAYQMVCRHTGGDIRALDGPYLPPPAFGPDRIHFLEVEPCMRACVGCLCYCFGCWFGEGCFTEDYGAQVVGGESAFVSKLLNAPVTLNDFIVKVLAHGEGFSRDNEFSACHESNSFKL